MTTFVVPTDGSAFADRALRPACALASRLGQANLLLVSCTPGDGGATQAHLEDRASLFGEVVDVATQLVDEADPAEGILRTVSSTPDATLCMATHGHGGLRTAVLGSVAEKVVRRCTDPLVLVGPACRTALLPGEVGRLLVCSDGSDFSAAILPTAVSWATRLDLQPCIAEVVPPDETVNQAGTAVRNRQVEAASARLERLADRFGESPHTASFEVLHGTPVSRSITGFADRLPAALVAMATHGRSGLTRTAMGSVAAEVARYSPCPLLLTRP
jgi:nucleotide-binding universal stress UspA family protein